jgi:hypothetical protein
MSDATHPLQPPSMRLIFEYEGETVRLVMQQPVDALITSFDVARAQPRGYYVDIQDASSRTLARVPAHGAFQNSAEVFPEQPGEPITRVDIAQPRGAFTVIVPVPPDANHVTVVHVTLAQPDTALPAARTTSAPEGALQEREIARFPLNLSR